jgi:23S rRNA (cytosine1962-C5)-methyltransferase
MNKMILKSGKEKALLQKHPWIFSGAVQEIQGEPANGESLAVYSSTQQFLGVASYSPYSQIRGRMWSFKEETIDLAFFRMRIRNALARRAKIREMTDDSGWRLIHGESDLLPGLVVDLYNDVLVVQILSSGAEYCREMIIEALLLESGVANIFERSDVDVRKLEGLVPRVGLICGTVPDSVLIREGKYQFWVHLKEGQKTGFYLDQRENRQIAAKYCTDKDVLNVFSFTGGFSVHALGNGARMVVSMDSSQEALAVAQDNVKINGLENENTEWIAADAFQHLRKMRDQGRSFDVIILDPPKFAPTAAQVERAARGYKDINLLGFKLLRPGGVLITFSCSGGLTEALFQKIVADAALDAGVDAMILERLHQGIDHPVGLAFPEGAYLKGLIVRKD